MPKFVGAVRYNVLKSCATRVCCACGNLTACVAVMYLALHRGRGMGGHIGPPLRKKKSFAVSLFEAVAGLWSAPDYQIKGNWSPKRIATIGVYPFGTPAKG